MQTHEIEKALSPYVARYVNDRCTNNGIAMNTLPTWRNLYHVTLSFYKMVLRETPIAKRRDKLNAICDHALRIGQISPSIGVTPIVRQSEH